MWKSQFRCQTCISIAYDNPKRYRHCNHCRHLDRHVTVPVWPQGIGRCDAIHRMKMGLSLFSSSSILETARERSNEFPKVGVGAFQFLGFCQVPHRRHSSNFGYDLNDGLQEKHVGVAEEVPPGARVTWWHQGWHQGWHQALSHLEGGGEWEDGNWSCYVVFACFRSKFQSRFVHKWGILICMVIDKGKIMINYETFRGLLQFLDKSRRHLSEWQIQTSRCGHWGYASALTIWMRCQWVGVTAHRDWRLLQEFVVPIRMPQAIYCRTVIMSQSCL